MLVLVKLQAMINLADHSSFFAKEVTLDAKNAAAEADKAAASAGTTPRTPTKTTDKLIIGSWGTFAGVEKFWMVEINSIHHWKHKPKRFLQSQARADSQHSRELAKHGGD